MVIPTEEQKRRWDYIQKILSDLLENPQTLDAVTDMFYRLVWDDKAY